MTKRISNPTLSVALPMAMAFGITTVHSFAFVLSGSLSAYDKQYQAFNPIVAENPTEASTAWQPVETEESTTANLPKEDKADFSDYNEDQSIILEGDEQRQYQLFTADGIESTSGKSAIVEARQGDQPVIAKVSANTEQLQREVENFRTITDDGNNDATNLFVEVYDYIEDPVTDEIIDADNGSGAIVMERGARDLRAHLREFGPMKGEELRKAGRTMAQAAIAIHDSDMVWTELKASNFVVKDEEDDTVIKGIDLESAVGHREKLVDFTPEAVPPEFAKEYLCGRQEFVEMEYHFDVWSLGMLLYELATGKPYFHGDEAYEIINKRLRMFEEADLDDTLIEDDDLKDLIHSCLQVNPDNRPGMKEVLDHPYFQ